MSLRKFTVLSGTHFDVKTKTRYKVGDTVVSSGDLAKLFANKFRDDGEATAADAKKSLAAGEKVKLAGTTSAPSAPVAFASALGDDVTAEFKDVPAGFKVVSKGSGKFFVVRESAPDVAAHEGAAINGKQVASFLAAIEE